MEGKKNWKKKNRRKKDNNQQEKEIVKRKADRGEENTRDIAATKTQKTYNNITKPARTSLKVGKSAHKFAAVDRTAVVRES